MRTYRNLRELFENENFQAGVTEMLCNRRYSTEIEPFLNFCHHFIIDARNCGSELLVLSTANHNKVGFEVKTFKNSKAQLSPESFIQTVRCEGMNGLNILLNCPLGLSIDQDEESSHILMNFGNWAFGHMTPVTEWGQILLGKEMGTELREIGLQLFELSLATSKRMEYILKLVQKLKNQ